VVGTRAHAEIIAWIGARRPDLELRGAAQHQVTPAMLDWADVFVGFRRPPTPTLGSVRWVHCTGAGVDAWLYPRAIDPGILLTRTPESFGPMIAEWVLARMLAFSQRILELDAAQRAREWSTIEPSFLAGSRALLLGVGDVGRAVARVLKACDVRVVGVSRAGRGEWPFVDRVHPSSALPDLVSDADALIVTLPLTRETEGLVSRELLSRCRGALLVNTGRGAVVDEGAIPEALNQGWLRGVALDVFRVEPLPADSLLWADPRVMIAPHNSGPTTVAGAGAGFLECLEAIERGETSRWVVDRARGY
jgi:phosphoglycerate dehydrogenase-like enzyme